MDIILATTPQNILEEKQKFLADNSYNPQLTYASDLPSQAELHQWGEPREKWYLHSRRMLEEFPLTHSNPSSQPPDRITPEEMEQAIAEFNQRYQLPTPITAIFSENLVTRCRVSGLKIYFQLPIHYTHARFADLYRHELETHILRRLNHRTQGWEEEICPESELRLTEEGLAGLHTHLLRTDKLFRKSYLTYTAVYLAQRGSFVDVYRTMRDLKVTAATAWNIALRTKRGLRDTSQPGGLTKDITYLEGAIQVWNWLQNPDHQPQDLYIGRISIHQVEKYRHLNQTSGILYPSFFDNMQEYHQLIQEIGEVNRFTELTP